MAAEFGRACVDWRWMDSTGTVRGAGLVGLQPFGDRRLVVRAHPVVPLGFVDRQVEALVKQPQVTFAAVSRSPMFLPLIADNSPWSSSRHRRWDRRRQSPWSSPCLRDGHRSGPLMSPVTPLV